MDIGIYTVGVRSFISISSYELRQRKMRFDKVVLYFESMTTDHLHIRVPFQRVSSVSKGPVPIHRMASDWYGAIPDTFRVLP